MKLRTWQGYENGRSTPKAPVMAGLVSHGISAEWLITGEGPMRRQGGSTALPQSGGYTYVPLHEVSAAAGAGSEVGEEQIVDFLAFRTTWIRRDLRAKPEDLAVIWVFGDSMEPTLSDGDVVMVDRSRNRPDAEGVYVLRTDNMLLVKRLQYAGGRMMIARSDNPSYPPMELRLTDIGRDIHIVGRVVWAGKRF